MRNPYGVEPSQYMKRKKSDCAIKCAPGCGPSFGDDWHLDIYISDRSNTNTVSSIDNDGTHGYECDPEYKSSLFVNSAGPNEGNEFSVLDYEVYTHN